MFGYAFMMLLIVVVSLGNLCLGYAAALWIGRGPKTLWPLVELSETRAADAAPQQTDDLSEPNEAEESNPAEEPDADDEEVVQEATATSVISGFENVPNEKDDDDLAALMDGEFDSIKFGESENQASPIEIALQQIIQAISDFEDGLVQSDRQLRNCADIANTDSLQVFSSELTSVAQRYLDQLQATIKPLQAVGEKDPSFAESNDQLMGSLDTLASRFNMTLSELNDISYEETNLEANKEELFNASGELLDIFHATRAQLTQPLMLVVSSEPDLTGFYRRLLGEEKNSLAGGIRFEMILEKWKSEHEGTDSAAPLHVGMLDLDRLSSLNEKHGPLAANQILETMVEKILTVWDVSENYVQLDSQQFVAFFPEVQLDEALEKVERARQLIAKTTFKLGEEEANATLSGAVSAVQDGETSQELLSRLRNTLQKAKDAGRNRCFLYRDGVPEPVAPIELEIEEQIASL